MKAAILALLMAGCAPAASAGTLTAWEAPLAWAPDDLQEPVLRLLAERDLDPYVVGGRGARFWVPCERHGEARALLVASPHAARLKIHTLVLGPGPAAPRWAPGSNPAVWSDVGSFTLSALPALRVQDALKAGGIECGVIAFTWNPGTGVLYVPSVQAAAARALLKETALGDGIRITW